MNQFFKDLAEAMTDRQECILNIKKIGDDFVVMVTPDLKKKGTVIHMTGNPEEMDLNFLHEFKKTPVIKAEFKAEATENEDLNDDESTEPRKDGESTKDYQGRLTGKKNSSKKKEEPKGKKKPAKPTAKKTEPSIQKVSRTERVKEGTTVKGGPGGEIIDTKKSEKEEATDKLKADKATFDELMANGKKEFEERKYKEAEAAFKLAIALFPNDAKAKKELDQATKWVAAMEKLEAE